MKRGIFIVFLLAIFVAPVFVSAVDTSVTINTLPNHNVEVRALEPDQVYGLIDSKYTRSDENGQASVTLSSSIDQFKLGVWIKQGNDLIKYEKPDEIFAAGSPIILEIYPEWYLKQKKLAEEIALRNLNNRNNSEETTENAEETDTSGPVNESEESPGISGLAVFGDNGIFSGKKMLYTLGILVIIGVFAFGAFSMMKMRKELMAARGNNSGKTTDKEKQKKLAEARKKLIDDEKELMKLRDEKD